MILKMARSSVLQDQFCTTKEKGKVHISISPITKLLRCGATGEHLLGAEYHGDDADVCKRCFASYYRYESRLILLQGLGGGEMTKNPYDSPNEYNCHNTTSDAWREGQQAGLAQGYEKGYIEGTKDGLELSKACEASVYKQGQKDLAKELEAWFDHGIEGETWGDLSYWLRQKGLLE